MKKYNMFEGTDPCWLMVEPILFEIWADGILKSKSLHLQAFNIFGWVVGVPRFLGGLVLRSVIVASILLIAYLIFPKTLSISFDLIFSGKHMYKDLWAYKLLGYVLIVKSVVFIFGDNFKRFIVESSLFLLLLLTNMLPLRYLARGFKKESPLAQIIAKSPFIGELIVQFTLAMPQDSLNHWDEVFDLYTNSNRSSAREELERLAEEHAKKKI